MTLRQTLLLLACVFMVIPAGEAGLGSARAEVSASVTDSPCFGAAARSPLARCVNPRLQRTVFPTPSDALLEPNAPCKPFGRSSLLFPCIFGARGATGREVTTLIGDSHASHWRAAVDVVAAGHNWPAISLTRSGCPFIRAQVIIPRDEARTCRRWNRELLAWLRRHKEVTSIFLSHRSEAQYVHSRGVSNFETAVRGHLALWSVLPKSVRNIFVIRDTPVTSPAAAACVRRTFAHGQPSAMLCARARRKALYPDPAVAAARRTHQLRVHVLDMTPFFCDRTHCYPVVGGALVHKDTNHITAIFARTLGRFMLRMVDDILQGRRQPVLTALLPDERAFAECLLSERALSAQAGGWEKVGPEHLGRAQTCRIQLEMRAAQIRAAGLSGRFNRANRYAAIRQVLDVGRGP
ncbi:MAG TPA: SGNH hydrolase domain-containing protein [Solirubrobacteraceae bacterium]|nr:SGNH hydrolase domain-containing protein [Solirubrobacteraceae bacterium]